MWKVALRKGAGVTRSRGKIVLIQVSDVKNDKEQSSTCTKSVNKVWQVRGHRTAPTQQEADNTGSLASSGNYMRLAAKLCQTDKHIAESCLSICYYLKLLHFLSSITCMMVGRRLKTPFSTSKIQPDWSTQSYTETQRVHIPVKSQSKHLHGKDCKPTHGSFLLKYQLSSHFPNTPCFLCNWTMSQYQRNV